MSASAVFLDTNVLVYAVAADDPRKPIANELITAGATVSVQTLNEFVAVTRSSGGTPGMKF